MASLKPLSGRERNAFGWDQLPGTHLGTPSAWHTALTALAQLRAIAVQLSLSGAIVLPAGPGIRPGQPPAPRSRLQ